MLQKNAPIREFMTPAPLTIDGELPLSEARDRMADAKIRHLPVLRDDRVIGVISSTDIVVIDGLGILDPSTISVEAAMSGNAVTVQIDATLDETLAAMENKHVHSVAVLDGKSIAGIFTSADAAQLLRRALVG